MLPELILREEYEENYPLLFILGVSSALLGYALASMLFPSEADLTAVLFAAIPLVYPLTSYFLEDEEDGKPHLPEVKVYGALFAGEVAGFYLLGLAMPSNLDIQVSIFSEQLMQMGITGYATAGASFAGILLNNLMVFGSIVLVATLIGSAGAFILTWNASVLGVFLGVLTRELPGKISAYLLGSGSVPTPLAYLPHAMFEMSGFVIGGIAGSLMSAAIYREHFDRETWKDFGKLVAAGVAMILLGAILETL